jgi:hypothetical protein
MKWVTFYVLKPEKESFFIAVGSMKFFVMVVRAPRR